jgi:hypothetical protein
MFRRWREEMAKHGYDPNDPPENGCHCAKGIGFLRKRKPYDCGRPNCGVCHTDPQVYRARKRKERQEAIKRELNA